MLIYAHIWSFTKCSHVGICSIMVISIRFPWSVSHVDLCIIRTYYHRFSDAIWSQ
jgi:hypothetical protein